jgi:transglutaminase-like putative cysteine protease
MLSPTLRFYSISYLTALLLIFFILTLKTRASAQGKNFSISTNTPSWIVKIDSNKGARPKDKDISNGYFISVYENQNHIELHEEYTHLVREVVSDAGVQNGSQISVTYDPSFQKLVFHKILLWRNNKSSDQMKAGKFKVLQNEKDLSKFIYSGTYDAFLLLEDVRKGDRIEYAYTIKGDNPIFGKKYASQNYFEFSSSLGQVYVNLIFDKNRNISTRSFNGAPAPIMSDKNGYRIYEWRNTLTHTYRNTDYEPSWYNPFKRVQLTEYKSWNEVVNWGLSVNDYPNLKSPLLYKKIKEFKEQAGNDHKKYIELASRFVQDEIRYMGIEMGIYSHRPNSPEQVLKQRYGDCKDKSLLLVHLLKAAGVNAYMVYVDTYSTIKTNEYLPSPFIFNHVIVSIEHEKRKMWIDPTISYQRGRFNDFYAPDYGYVLVIKPGVNALERINTNPKGKLASHLTFNVADTSGIKKSTLLIKSVYTDNYADNIRSTIAESGTDGLEKDYLEYYTKYYTDVELKAPMEITDDEKKNAIEIIESYEIDNIWIRNEDNNHQYVNFYGDLISNELRKVSAKKRLEPLALKHPVNIEQKITIYLPYTYDTDTDMIKVKNANYSFELARKNSTNTASFNYKFRTLRSYMESDQVKTYIKDYKKVDENLSYYFRADNSGTGTQPDRINPYALLTSILTAVISLLFFIKVYRKSNDFDIDEIATARSIGGWLILLAIRIITGPFAFIIKIETLNLFENKFWNDLDGLGAIKGLIFKAAFAIDLVIYTLVVVFSVLCAILFFNRRESFPAVYIRFNQLLIGLTLYTAMISILSSQHSDIYLNIGYQIGTSILSATVSLLCIWYFKKSVRVKETFVFTYPESEWTKALIRHYNKKLTAKKAPLIANESEQINDNYNNDENI